MATFTEKRLLTGDGSINTAETTVYTVPAATTAIVKTIIITNVTGTDVEIDLWNPVVATTGVATKLLHERTIPANDFVQIITYIPMATTSTIIAQMTTGANDSATVSLYGAEIT